MSDWLDTVVWNSDGLVPAIAQEASVTVLTLAWMNREALARRQPRAWRITGRVRASGFGRRVKPRATFRTSGRFVSTAITTRFC